MNKLQKILKRLESVWCRRKASSYIPYLRRQGMTIGTGTQTTVYANPRNVFIDPTRPWLISLGRDVQITNGVKNTNTWL